MLNRKVTKAVIAAAGYGTRFLPATKSVPKEMLPILDTPILQYTVEELVKSGIKDIIIVTRYGNDAVEDHFDSLVELETFLERAGKTEKLLEIQKTFKMANIAFVRQRKDMPYGNAAPLLSAKPFLGRSNFCFAYGDDLTLSDDGVPAFKELIDAFEGSDASAVIAAQTVPENEVDRYGIIKFKSGSKTQLDRLIEKPSKEEAPSLLASYGRYVCTHKVFEYLAPDKVGKGGEIWFPDGIDRMAQNRKVLVKEPKAHWYTTGDPLRFLQATLEFAMRREDLRGDILEYMRMMVMREGVCTSCKKV